MDRDSGRQSDRETETLRDQRPRNREIQRKRHKRRDTERQSWIDKKRVERKQDTERGRQKGQKQRQISEAGRRLV